MRLSRTLLASFLASSLLAAACGDDAPIDDPDPDAGEPEPEPEPVEYDAVFTGAPDANVIRALVAGVGLESSMLGIYAMFFANPDGEQTCPTVSEDAQGRVVLTGGCDFPDDGGHVGGRLIIENLAQLGVENPTAPVVLTAEDFSIPEEDAGSWTFDGVVRLEPGRRTVIDLTSTYLGVEARIANRITCDADGNCTPEDDAEIDVDGIGRAKVAGQFNFSAETESGTLILIGEERLEAEIVEGECIPLTIDGVASQLCEDGGKRLARPRR